MHKFLLSIAFFFTCLLSFSQWTQTNGPEGGYTDEIVQVGNDLFVTANNAGIYKSTDIGDSWFPVNSGLPDNAQSLALFEYGSEIYASIGGNGIYKSVDAGNNWVALNNGIENETFYSLYVEGVNIFAGNANGGISYSNDGGLSWTYSGDGISNFQFRDFESYNSKIYASSDYSNAGLYESSDNGASWLKIENIGNDFSGAGYLMVMQDVLYVSSGIRIYSTNDVANWTASEYVQGGYVGELKGYNNQIYALTSQGRYNQSSDFGQSWVLYQNSNVNFGVLDLFLSEGKIIMTSSAGIFSSIDSGTTWNSNNSGISALNITALFSNNTFTFAGSSDHGIYRSTNEGSSWESINSGLVGYGPQNINKIIEVDDILYIATGGGIFSSTDNGDSWTLRLDSGLNQSNDDLAYDKGVFVTATSGSSIYRSTDMMQSWSQVTIDALSEPSYFREIEIKGDTIAVSTNNSDVYISKNLGGTWQKSTSLGSSTINSLEISGDKIYLANYNAVYVSNDLGESWEVLNNSFRPNEINDIAISEGVIYAASSNGFYVTADSRNEWYSLSDGLDGSGLSRLAISDNYVFSGVGSSSVWKLPKAEAALPPPIEYPFVTRWYTGYQGTSDDNQITIPTHPGETYNYNVDWGDGTTSEGVMGDIIHTYAEIKDYTVSITGVFPRIYFNNSGDKDKITGVSAWGTTNWASMEKAFYGCSNLGVYPSDEPDFSLVKSTESMFEDCRNLNTQYYNINEWNMSAVKNMKRMFYGAERFIGDISGWNVSNVENMESMFENALDFNNDIGNWNVSQVLNMKNMFKGAIVFNIDISNWNVGNVTDMTGMFQSAIEFDQNLANWNVAKVQSLDNFLSGVSLSIENYDELLTGWSGLSNLQNGVHLDAGISNYCTAANERQSLVDSFGWTIADAGLSCTADVASFITVWKTDNTGDSEDNQITIPTASGETYNYTVQWGDGNSDEGVTADITHTYDSPGIYQVSISGNFPRIFFDNSGDREKILQIKQWGDIQWTSMEGAFDGCRNIDMKSTDLPNLSNVISLERMFQYCYDFKGNESIAEWNTTSITNMSSVFRGVNNFDFDLSDWVVAQVINMSGLFANTNFNQDISNWNVSNVEDMSEMFYSAYNFNQDISQWNTSNVKHMQRMFYYANNFNQSIGNWDVTAIENMSYMFGNTRSFNQDLSNWNLGNVTNLEGMFYDTQAFNQDLSAWNVSQVTTMKAMFSQAESFDQNLGNWDISNVLEMSFMFTDVVLSQENYDNTLMGWFANGTPQQNVIFDGGSSRYCLGVDARQSLISDYGWVITDKGEKCPIATDAIWLEAECATVGANWSLIASADASEGQYLLAPQGNNATMPPTDENAIVAFNFDAEAGAYKVYVRVNTPSQEDDSFWVRANGGEWQLWDLIPGNTDFSWHQIHDGEQNTVFTSFELVDGPNTLEFGHREDGAGIDKVFVTNTNEVPEGFGTLSSNCPQNAFVTTWQTDIENQWDSSITIPTQSGGYNYTIDWGDGNSETNVSGDITHYYDTPGTYTVSITGDFPRIHFNYGQDRSKIISIDQWGDMEWLSMEDAFQGCINLQLNATDTPDLSLVTSLYGMFSNCEILLGNESFNSWDVSGIDDFNYMFRNAKLFNSDLSNWDVSNGLGLNGMFSWAETFNQNIGSWNLESAENIYGMFENAKSFNGEIGAWQFPKVNNLGSMFRNASSFDQDISSWDVSGIEYMWGVFQGATVFNQDISSWDVTNVWSMERMFSDATAFNQDLGDWNISRANNLSEMFKGVTLSLENYDSLLTKWSALPNLNYGVTFDGGNSQYCLGTDARQILVNNKGWTITDGGENCTSIRLVVDAGDNQTITLPATTSAIFNGTASSPDGEIVSYSWVYVSGPNTPMLTGQDTADLIATSFAVGTYTFILTVVDDQGQSAFDEVTLQVLSGGNSSPVVNAGQDQNSTETSITLNGSGSDPDGGDVSFVWSQESGPNTADLANQNTTALTASNLIDGAYVFRLTVTDDENDTTFDEVIVTITTPEVFALRINTGGTEVDYNEETFVADTYFNTGSTLDRPQTGLPEPYQTFRFSRSQEMSYDIPLEDGEYKVNLYFAELWFGATGGGSGGVGSRVFDVTIEGQLAEDNLDVFAEAGADAMLMRSHTVTVTGGILDIDFNSTDAVGGSRHPIINAIEILGEVTAPVERPFVFSLVREASFYEIITIPVNNNVVYNYTVDWGDGIIDSNLTGASSHTYATPNREYKISITGKFPRIYFGQLVPIDEFDSTFTIYQWGDQKWSSFEDAFGLEQTKIVIAAEDSPDFSETKNLSGMFAYAFDLDGSASMHTWDVSNIEDMSSMFWRSIAVNADISGWDVSNVKDMSSMFAESSFNQNIGNWNVANVVNMNSMFSGATVFNQDISAWNTSSVTNMDHLFFRASSFNQNLNSWGVSNVNNFSSIFGGAENFNKPIGDWNVSSANEMQYMFSGASSFNQDISNWDVANVVSMKSMFSGATVFNQNISTWDVSNVTSMLDMFALAESFDQNIGTWNIGNVSDMRSMFYGASLSIENYDNTLIGWSSQQVQSEVTFDGSGSQYCQGEAARQKLIDDFGWTITDAGKAEDCADTTSFITTWKTDNPGVSEDNQITIHTSRSNANYVYYYSINWGDGTYDSGVIGDITHTYNSPGIYEVSISGEFPAVSFGIINGEQKDNLKLLEVNQWGSQQWAYLNAAFDQCKNMDVLATDLPDLSIAGILGFTFRGCESLVFNNSIGSWEVENITYMANLFSGCALFNQDIGNWDVSNVRNMGSMFIFSGFNQDIGNWDVSKVTSMNQMFSRSPFDQDIGGWAVGNVINMSNMFKNVGLSNQNYDKLLIGWSSLPSLQSNVYLEAGNSQYCDGEEARQKLIDDFGWTITDAGRAADCPEPNDFALRINTGGAEVEYNDETFIADTYFNTGSTLDRPQTGLSEPFQTFRFSRSQEMGYDIPLEDGEYIVNLYFAELWFGATGGGSGGVGSRVFDVNIEGELVEDNLDVFAEAGADAMLMKSHTVTVTGGILVIDFDSRDAVGGARHPIINAIEILGQVTAPVERPFVTTWKTDNPGTSGDNQITIPTFPGETYNYTVEWGDGTIESGNTGIANRTHTYDIPGTYQVSISGDFPRIYFNDPFNSGGSDNDKIISIDQWGSIEWNSMSHAFAGCDNLDLKAIDAPNLTNVSSTDFMFSNCLSLLGNSSMDLWDIGSITEMDFMFFLTPNFNQNIGSWNMENVTNMISMFGGATTFNGNVGGWNVSKVTEMTGMFSGASNFDQNISNWDVSKVANMGGMFSNAISFDQNISIWNVSSVNDMSRMFKNASSFNQDIGNWNVENVMNMDGMFDSAISFDQNIQAWNIESVRYMAEMFKEVTLSQVNYDSLLNVWSTQQLQNSVTFDGGNSQYCQGEAARQKLIDDFGWIITDAGKSAVCIDTTSFITTWKTDNPGISEDNQITIPTFDGETYNYTVHWGDGTSDSGVAGDITHTYTTAGTYEVSISGEFPRIYFNNLYNYDDGNEQKLVSIDLWGDIAWRSMNNAFAGCLNMDLIATDIPDFSNLTDLDKMFSGCYSFMGNESMMNWDVSLITKLSGMFIANQNFNALIGDWNTSSVTDMSSMFLNAKSFNQDISGWDTGNVTRLDGAFFGAEVFNQDIGQWDVSNVVRMDFAFFGTFNFNQDIGDWDVSKVEVMFEMFSEARSFNQDLSRWNVEQLQEAGSMFYNSGLSNTNYDKLLIGWSQLPLLQENVQFHADQNLYCDSAEAREFIIDNHNWTIIDAGKAADCIDSTSFITTWKTDNPGRNDNEIMIPTYPGEIYNFTVDWGDGSSDSGVSEAIIHTYESPGTYTVSIAGQFPRVILNSVFYNERLIAVNQWGSTAWSSMELAFDGCINLDVLATDVPNLSSATSLANMFSNCTNLKGTNEFSLWDVSSITDMSTMFYGTDFDQPIGTWNVSQVSDMNNMFGESAFNQNIGDWNVGNITNMEAMFSFATEFNQDISTWNVSNVESMATMFEAAGSFNQPIGIWNVSKVTNMYGMFAVVNSFDQDLGAWNVGYVENMNNMFYASLSMSQDNYDKLLIGWNSLPILQNNVRFGVSSEYCAGGAAKQSIIDNYGWEIGDYGKAADCEEPSNLALRINTGGSETDYNGETFIADTHFDTGRTLDRPQTGLPEPFQTFRYSRSQEMSYDIPIEDGEYTVNLYFAELWFGATGGGLGGVGSRVFDVSIEGELAEDNLDIFAEVGADAMLMKSYTVTVTGGVLDIDFDSRALVGGERHPVINAIEILGSSNGDTTPVTNISATDVTSSSFTVDWTLSSPHTGQIQWGTTATLGNVTILESNFLTQHIQSATNLEPATTYYYRVIGEDAMGASFVGNIRSVKTLTAGSGKSAFVNTAILSPNPVVSTTTLSFEKPVELTDILVFDVTGKLVHTYKAAETEDNGAYLLNVHNLPAGTYFINSLDVEGVKHQKQMVIKK